MFRAGSALLLLLLAPAVAFAQGGPQVIRDNQHDVSPPLRDLPPAARHVGELEAEPVRVIPSRRSSRGPDLAVQGQSPAPANLAPTPNRNFDGLGAGFAGFSVRYAPPDNNGAVGASQFVEIVNAELVVFRKDTQLAVYGPVPVNTIWAGFGGGCQNNNDGDPTVVYDRLAHRWVMSQFSVSSKPYLQCVAVSMTEDAAGAYARYSFPYDRFSRLPEDGRVA